MEVYTRPKRRAAVRIPLFVRLTLFLLSTVRICTSLPCGDGNVGNGTCERANHCCSIWGYCSSLFCDGEDQPDAMCGDGVIGNGTCLNPDDCCSPFGYCGTTSVHCSMEEVPCGDGTVGNGVCINEDECCSPSGSCGTDHCGGNEVGCGNGIVGNGKCRYSHECCSEHGYCSVSAEHCGGDVTILSELSQDNVLEMAEDLSELDEGVRDAYEAVKTNPDDDHANLELRLAELKAFAGGNGLEYSRHFENARAEGIASGARLDRKYEAVRDTALVFMKAYCELADYATLPMAISEEALACACNGEREADPVRCSSMVEMELLNFVNDYEDDQFDKQSAQAAGCTVKGGVSNPRHTSDLFQLFLAAITGNIKESVFIQATCTVPFPPAPAFDFIIRVGASIPYLDPINGVCNPDLCCPLRQNECCMDWGDYMAAYGQAIARNARSSLWATLCLRATNHEIFNLALPILRFLGLDPCLVSLMLNHYYLAGTLEFHLRAKLTQFVSLIVETRTQLYDDFKDGLGLCEGVTDCSKPGSTACSMCKGEESGSITLQFHLGPFGSGILLFCAFSPRKCPRNILLPEVSHSWGNWEGQCNGKYCGGDAIDVGEPSAPDEHDKIFVAYTTTWAQYRLPGEAEMPDGQIITRPEWCGDFARKPVDALASGATHIMYAFAVLDLISYKLITYEWNDEDLMADLNSKKECAKTLISIGGWSFSQGETSKYGLASSETFATMARSQEGRSRFIHSSIDFAHKHGFDGIDLDWEFPKEKDSQFFLILLQEMRSAITKDGQGLLFTAAMPAGRTLYEQIELGAAAASLDFINLMSYDFHGGSFEPVGPIFSQTPVMDCRPNSPSDPDDHDMGGLDLASAIEDYIQAGVPKYKIVFGLGVYGRTWTLPQGGSASPGSPAVGSGPVGACTQEAGSLAYYEIMRSVMGNIHYDPSTMSSYAEYVDYGWVAFDDPKAMHQKVCWAKDLGLGGVMIWDADQDTLNWELTRAITETYFGKFDDVCNDYVAPACYCGNGVAGNNECATEGECCSKHGFCGTTPEFCGTAEGN